MNLIRPPSWVGSQKGCGKPYQFLAGTNSHKFGLTRTWSPTPCYFILASYLSTLLICALVTMLSSAYRDTVLVLMMVWRKWVCGHRRIKTSISIPISSIGKCMASVYVQAILWTFHVDVQLDWKWQLHANMNLLPTVVIKYEMLTVGISLLYMKCIMHDFAVCYV